MEDSGFLLTRWAPERHRELAVRGGRGGARRLVRHYVGYEEQANGLIRRQVANAGVSLILAFGDPFRVGYPSARWTTVGACIVGTHSRPTRTAFDGRQHGVQVDLTPEGACAVLGASLQQFTDRVVPVEEVLGRPGADLLDRLANSPSWAERFAVLDETLGTWRPHARLDPAVAWVWSQLRGRHGAVRIDSLVDETGWSRRHFTRKFERQIGLRPKAAARLARFHHALDLLPATGSTASLAAVAARAGYYDQAHFSREFREFAGCTPTQYLAGGDEDAQVVHFVQDDQQEAAVASSP